MSYSFNLEEEKPEIYFQKRDEKLESLNIKLKQKYESSTLTITRQRLKEIDVLQNLIKNTLTEQDERIDEVVLSTKEAKKNFLGSNKYFEKTKNRGRRIRRFLIILFFCMSFVLLFANFYHS